MHMYIAIFFACVPVGLAIYFGLVRPFLIPLDWRIPTGRAYRATLIHTNR